MIIIWISWLTIVAFSAWAYWTLRHSASPEHAFLNSIIWGLCAVLGAAGFVLFAWKQLRKPKV
jgi:hypothetical protein